MVAPPKDPHDIELIDYQQLRDWGSFVLHAVLRRKLRATITFLVVLGASLLLIAILPRTYHVEAQLLAQRNSLMSALGNPDRAIPPDADAPTKGAVEAVKRRDNVVAVMKQTDLMKEWERTRPRVLKLRDRVADLLLGPRSEDEKINDMIGLLDERLNVFVGDSTVTISLDWPQAQMAYRLVDTAQHNFLDQRHAAEVSTIEDAITILEGHAATLKEAIDTTVEEMRQPPGAAARASPNPRPRRDPAEEALRAEAADLKLRLEAKRRGITELETFRARRLAELQAELEQAKTVYAEAHPALVKLTESITALQQDSPQLTTLREEERDLVTEQSKLAVPPPVPRISPDGRSTTAASEEVTRDYGRARLRFAMQKYESLMVRIQSAKIELDTARAAFKYRYAVIRPPDVPKRAVKPKVPLLVAMGVLAALGMATLVAVLSDLRSGRIFEEWQVEKNLGLRFLGEVPRA